MNRTKKIKLVIILVLIIAMVISIVYSLNKSNKVKKEIDNSLSVEYISDEKIVNGILAEKSRIQKEEYSKIWKPEIGVLITGTILIAGVLIINTKERKEKNEYKRKSDF